MRRKSNQITYSQTISQSTYEPNKVYNYSSYQKEKAHFISKTNPIPVRIINNIKENRLEQRDTNQRQYQQKLIIRNPNLKIKKEIIKIKMNILITQRRRILTYQKAKK